MTNADERELAKFEALAHRWWDPEGEFRPLHDINGPRIDYIRERCTVEGRRALDVGCGGGLATEALAELGAKTTGIDAAEAPLAVAKLHAAERGLGEHIDYVRATPEEYLETGPDAFEIVLCLETLEHVPDVGAAVDALAQLAAPGGDVFLATINRTAKAFALAIVGAEYLLNILPKGTHSYEKLVRPSELGRACRASGLQVLDIVGVAYNPFTHRCAFGRDVGVNYMLHARKPPALGSSATDE